MLLAEQYLTLYRSLIGNSDELSVQTNISSISEALDCTSRNAKYVVKEMQQLDWIKWNPKPGRGKSSLLIFQKSDLELFEFVFRQKVIDGDLSWCFKQLKHFEDSARKRFLDIMYDFFGFHIDEENKNQRDILRLPYPFSYDELSPQNLYSAEQIHLVKQIFDTVVRYNPNNLEIGPHIAHTIEANHDGTEYTLFLRKGVFFHSGKELTGHDVKYTITSIKNNSSGILNKIFHTIKHVSVPHPLVVNIQLGQPNALFLSFLASPEASIIPEGVLETAGKEFVSHPNGTGPFKVSENNMKRVVFEAHTHYFKERPLLDRVEFWAVPEAQSPFYSAPLIPEAAKWDKMEVPERGAMHLIFNTTRGVCAEKSFRDALTSSLNRNDLKKELGDNCFLTDYLLETNKPIRNENSKKLKKFTGNTVTLGTIPGKMFETTAVWLQRQCEKFGVHLKIKYFDLIDLNTKDVINQVDVFLLKQFADDHLEWDLVYSLFADDSLLNLTLNQEISERKNKLLSMAFQEPSVKRRFVLYRKIEKMLKEEFAIAFLFRNKQTLISYPSLQGPQFGNLPPYHLLWLRPKIEI